MCTLEITCALKWQYKEVVILLETVNRPVISIKIKGHGQTNSFTKYFVEYFILKKNTFKETW